MEINGEIWVKESSIEQFIVQDGDILQLGQKYYIRTVTHHYTGRLIQMDDQYLVLSDSAWIADSGRWKEAIGDGILNEVEPYPDQVIVNRHAVCDIAIWNHELPREQK